MRRRICDMILLQIAWNNISRCSRGGRSVISCCVFRISKKGYSCVLYWPHDPFYHIASRGVGEFEMKDTWDPPISIYMFSRSDDLLIDVQLYLDGKVIEEFTIQERLVIDTRYMIKSEKPQSFTVRLMAQFDFVPASYLIIIVAMLVISLLYSILTYARYRQL
ncbi:unnamed protein product (macronuclear) [Paramecium tetraurelia]|uniref:Uncharacterized protein n=1 Tax=Paramecium tetraurelia TaxID=5888 RepID=A0C2S3_PARTE|nr:uncharacterized protein GSPATT00034568001 [Paramecium tetraurelia]CAK65090.1 unnamed protein product [Paramecium tetraurelia]|eukprot:XP_001432487.1 hypothetical protein (macronuclear) [Paramecium tetraurelia strain d4-2]